MEKGNTDGAVKLQIHIDFCSTFNLTKYQTLLTDVINIIIQTNSFIQAVIVRVVSHFQKITFIITTYNMYIKNE